MTMVAAPVASPASAISASRAGGRPSPTPRATPAPSGSSTSQRRSASAASQTATASPASATAPAIGTAAADPDSQARLRRAYGRFTRNFVVQGTGAEWALCWVADLRNRLWRLAGAGPLVSRPHLVFFLHDEVVVHTPAVLADTVAAQATEAATTAAGLLFRGSTIDFPLNISVVRSYADAGKPGAELAAPDEGEVDRP